VNIKAVAAMSFGSDAILRLIPDDVNAARQALQSNHIRFDEHELVAVLLENKAESLRAWRGKWPTPD